MGENGLPLALLEVNNPFRADEGMTAGDGGNTGDGISLRVLRIRLIYCVEVWTASGDLGGGLNQRPINGMNRKIE